MEVKLASGGSKYCDLKCVVLVSFKIVLSKWSSGDCCVLLRGA